jgi:2-dehydropantoate 2-reductase
MKLLVLGAGGTGGYFGGRLAASGADVTFLVRQKRHEQLAREGLRVRSPLGNLDIPVKTIRAEELEPNYDLILLSCKAYDLDSAMNAIAPAMNGNCAIIPVLNGIAHLDALDKRFGASNILGGACMIDATLDKSGIVQHMGALQRIVFGERDGKRSERAESFVNALAKTPIDYELSDNIMLVMWEKISFLSALAATACLFRGNVGEIISAPGGREAIERTLDTNIEIAKREGYDLRDSVMDGARQRLTDPNGTWTASMQRDIEAGNPVEADHIVGFMLGLARKHKLDDTILSLAYTHLKTYEARRAAKRLPLIHPTQLS